MQEALREIRKLRKAAAFSLQEAADLLDRDPATISRWERGEQLPAEDGVFEKLVRHYERRLTRNYERFVEAR